MKEAAADIMRYMERVNNPIFVQDPKTGVIRIIPEDSTSVVYLHDDVVPIGHPLWMPRPKNQDNRMKGLLSYIEPENTGDHGEPNP